MSRPYRWQLALSTILLGSLALFATQGCTVTTDNNDGGDPGPGPGPTPTTCDECLYPLCSGEWSVCTGNSDCMRIYSCAINCPSGDGACTDNCYQSYPAGMNAYKALASCDAYYGCGSQECSSLCQSELVCDPTQEPGPAATCSDCTDQQCSGQKAQCGAGSECEQYSLCTNTCTDPDPNTAIQCVDDCGVAHHDGQVDSDALSNCATTQCPSQCGFQ